MWHRQVDSTAMSALQPWPFRTSMVVTSRARLSRSVRAHDSDRIEVIDVPNLGLSDGGRGFTPPASGARASAGGSGLGLVSASPNACGCSAAPTPSSPHGREARR